MEPSLDESDIERFWAGVDRSSGKHACHPWIKSKDKSGYGRFTVGKKECKAHRIAWYIAKGEPLPAWRELHHRCKNRLCCNVVHLEPLTHQENMKFVSGPKSEAYLYVRARAHRARKPVELLPSDAGVEFLAWAWRKAHERWFLFAPPLSSQDRRLLFELVRLLGEQNAFLTLCGVVRSWRSFVEYASREYGVSGRGVRDLPRRPVLSVLRGTGMAAAANFWRETDQFEIDRRQQQRAKAARGRRAAE